jgi:hypothetical protein
LRVGSGVPRRYCTTKASKAGRARQRGEGKYLSSIELTNTQIKSRRHPCHKFNPRSSSSCHGIDALSPEDPPLEIDIQNHPFVAKRSTLKTHPVPTAFSWHSVQGTFLSNHQTWLDILHPTSSDQGNLLVVDSISADSIAVNCPRCSPSRER